MEKTKEIINFIIEQIKENKWVHYAIIVIIGIILSISLNNIQIRDTHDGSLHMLRLLGTMDTLEIGQFPPLINQNYCDSMGYSMNLFYPPLVTYLPLLIKLFTSTYMVALKIFGSICIILSGITMYKFVYQVTQKRSIALFSAFFYLIAPYKLANVYKRFAIGEFTAMIFMPLVFLGLYNLFNQDGKKHYYIAIGAIGLMLSHTVTTLYTAIFCVIYILFNFRKLKQKDIVKKCIINVIFILLVTMLFWMPLLEATSSAEYTIMNNKAMRTNGEFVSDNIISFSQLLYDKGEENGTTFIIGIPTMIIMISTIFVIKKVDNKYKELYLLNIIFSLISLFMVSRFFPWKFIPDLFCKLQYPWRMLGFFILFNSFICGVNLYLIIKNISKKSVLRIIIIFIFAVISIINSTMILSQFYTKNDTLDETYETSIINNKKISHRQINRDYMPYKALVLQNSYVLDREDKTYVLSGNANILKEEKNNLTDKIELENINKDTILEFPYYYYVGYKITIETNNQIKEITPIESEHGYLSCVISEDIQQANINIKYEGTIITKISYIISAISLIVFIIYIVKETKKGESNAKN